MISILLEETMSAVVFLCLTFLSSGLAALPEGWSICKQSSPDFKTCIQKAIFDAIYSLMPGSKELGTNPLDPVTIERFVIPKHPGPVSIDFAFTNYIFGGLKDLRPTKFEFDWKNADVAVVIPQILSTANYKIDGKILTLPITGEGMSNFTLDEVQVEVQIQLGTTKKKGVEYLNVDHMFLNVMPKHMEMYFDNLFNGDKALGATTNTFLNENWKEVFTEFQPALSKGWAAAFTAIANQVLSKIPADQIKLP